MKSFKQMLKEDNKNFLYYYNQIDFIRAELYQCEKYIQSVLNNIDMRNEIVSDKELDGLKNTLTKNKKNIEDAIKYIQEWKNKK